MTVYMLNVTAECVRLLTATLLSCIKIDSNFMENIETLIHILC